jgi:hypothetical protein
VPDIFIPPFLEPDPALEAFLSSIRLIGGEKYYLRKNFRVVEKLFRNNSMKRKRKIKNRGTKKGIPQAGLLEPPITKYNRNR